MKDRRLLHIAIELAIEGRRPEAHHHRKRLGDGLLSLLRQLKSYQRRNSFHEFKRIHTAIPGQQVIKVFWFFFSKKNSTSFLINKRLHQNRRRKPHADG